jgi:hypothetical protein
MLNVYSIIKVFTLVCIFDYIDELFFSIYVI